MMRCSAFAAICLLQCMLASAFPAPQMTSENAAAPAASEQKTDWLSIGGLALSAGAIATSIGSLRLIKKQGHEHRAAFQNQRKQFNRRLRSLRHSNSRSNRMLNRQLVEQQREIGHLNDLTKAQNQEFQQLQQRVGVVSQKTTQLDGQQYKLIQEHMRLRGETREIRRASGLERQALELSDDKGNKYSLANDPELEACLLREDRKKFWHELVRGWLSDNFPLRSSRSAIALDDSRVTPLAPFRWLPNAFSGRSPPFLISPLYLPLP